MVLDEDLNVCLVRDHLYAFAYLITPVPDALAHLVQDACKFFQRELKLVDAAFVAALNPVQDAFVVRVELLDD